jgi:MFS family permease
MNKAIGSISNFMKVLVNGTKRFYINTCFTLIIFGITFYLINWDGISSDVTKILGRIIMVSILGFLISILFTLITERLNHSLKQQLKIINIIISFAIPVLYFFFILTDIDNRYQVTTLIGILIALALVSVYFSNKRNNEEFSIHFSYIVKNLFTAAIISLIVMLGLFLCMAAIYYLIYRFSDLDQIFVTILSFCWIVLFVNLFLAKLPQKSEEYRIPKFFKVITLYTALPIYVGLIFILYIYLGKIAITRKFPSGQLNWFASFASLIGIFLFVTLKQYSHKNTFVKWYVKLFGYVLLPIIIMQCIAVNIRFQNYGLTSVRYVSMILIGISIITAIVSLIKKGKHIPYVLFLGALCSLIVTTGPLNLYYVPLREQEARLVKVLKYNSMFDNNKIIPNPNIDQKEKIKITSAYNYIVYDDIEKSELLNEYNSKSFKQIFGFEKEFEENDYGRYDNNDIYVHYNSEAREIDISEYYSILRIEPIYYKEQVIKRIDNNILTVKYDEIEHSIDLNSFIKDLYEEYGTTDMIPQDNLVIEQDNIKFIITNIGFRVDKNSNEIEIHDVNGYILKK